MNVLLTHHFKQAAKRLHANQRAALEEAIQALQANPMLGDLKIADLAGVRVYKFYMLHLLVLLAYSYNEQRDEMVLLYFASHGNFYEKLKKKLKFHN